MPSGFPWEKKGILLWLVDFKKAPFPKKKEKKGTTGQLCCLENQTHKEPPLFLVIDMEPNNLNHRVQRNLLRAPLFLGLMMIFGEISPGTMVVFACSTGPETKAVNLSGPLPKVHQKGKTKSGPRKAFGAFTKENQNWAVLRSPAKSLISSGLNANPH